LDITGADLIPGVSVGSSDSYVFLLLDPIALTQSSSGTYKVEVAVSIGEL
jgi:hypothetical protein